MNLESQSFSEPQRQSTIGILVETVYSLVKLTKAWWPLLLIIVFRYDNDLYKVAGLSLLIVFAGIFGYLKYRNFSFMIDEERGEFIIQSGIFNKKRSVLQLTKIQQVSINQSFIQKLTNVYGVEIKTAGSTRSEAEIKAVSQHIAKRLKDKLAPDKKQIPELKTSQIEAPKQVPFFIHISASNFANHCP